MKIPVYSESEFNKELSLLQEDVKYCFRVTKREDKTSQKGNPMTVVETTPLVNGVKFPITSYFVYIDIKENRRGHFFQIHNTKVFLQCLKMPYTADAMERIMDKEGYYTLERKTNDRSGKQYWGVKEFILPTSVAGASSPTESSLSASEATTVKPAITSVYGDDDDIPF